MRTPQNVPARTVSRPHDPILGLAGCMIDENYNDDDYENGYDKNNEGVAVAERSPVCKTLKSFPKQWERAAQLPRL